ncbi:hypothetical protein F4804DRAFT_334164 [Jackrogersella minutella]|nr:hypothetical protein F4804DRAFT_334164 [Jackrogersella minutella]
MAEDNENEADEEMGEDGDSFAEQVAFDTEDFWRTKRKCPNKYGLQRFLEGYLSVQNRHQQGARIHSLRVALEEPVMRQRLEAAGIKLQFKEEITGEWDAEVPTFRKELG